MKEEGERDRTSSKATSSSSQLALKPTLSKKVKSQEPTQSTKPMSYILGWIISKICFLRGLHDRDSSYIKTLNNIT